MRSLNKTILLLLFLLLKICCVSCPTRRESLKLCKDEIYSEFKNAQPLDDLVHAFLNIKYETVYWDETSDTNEKIFRGNNVLKKSARDYVYELFNTALEMGIPDLLTPKDFCCSYHENEEDRCISAIGAIGCGANLSGPDCFEKMYFGWKKRDVDDTPMPGTKNLSDEQLLEAIYKGSAQFRNLSDKDLCKAFTDRSDIINNLSDDNLLKDYYRINYEAYLDRYGHSSNNPFRSRRSRYDRHRQRNDNDDPQYGNIVYRQYLRGLSEDSDYHNYPDDIRYSRAYFDDMKLIEARSICYGIPNASYSDICEEYQRRKSIAKLFDNLYALDICDKLKNSTWKFYLIRYLR